MATNETSSHASAAAAASGIAKPLSQLTRKQRQEVTSELLRIHNMLSDRDDHKDGGGNKADALSVDKKH